jgi:hypothetical protein
MAEFVHGGKRYRLTQEMVDAALSGVEPETIWQLAAGSSGRWYPVKQAFVRPLRLKNSDVNSRVAFNHLKAAGVPVHDTDADGPLPPSPPTAVSAPDPSPSPRGSRLEALGLAVDLLKSSPGTSASQVTEAADVLEAWLRGAPPV